MKGLFSCLSVPRNISCLLTLEMYKEKEERFKNEEINFNKNSFKY